MQIPKHKTTHKHGKYRQIQTDWLISEIKVQPRLWAFHFPSPTWQDAGWEICYFLFFTASALVVGVWINKCLWLENGWCLQSFGVDTAGSLACYWHHSTCLIWSVSAVPGWLNNLTLTRAWQAWSLTSRFVLTARAQSKRYTTLCAAWKLVCPSCLCNVEHNPPLSTLLPLLTCYTISDRLHLVAGLPVPFTHHILVSFYSLFCDVWSNWASYGNSSSLAKRNTSSDWWHPFTPPHTSSSNNYGTIYSRPLKGLLYLDEAL